MSLNNIVLSDLIITEWYGDTTLIPSGKPASLPQSASAPAPSAPPQSSAPAPSAPAPVPQPPSSVRPPAPPVQPSVQPAIVADPPKTNSPQPAADSPTTYKFLGNHRRKVTIIVDSPGSAFLPDDQLGFLTKILEACRMNIGDVAIVNHHTSPVAITALRQQLQPESILLFGVSPTAIRLPINFPEFKLQPYDQCTYLLAPPLQQLVGNSADSKLLKSKLWVSLKTLFNV